MGIRRDVMTKLVERAAGVFGVSAATLAAGTRFAEDLNAKSTQITQITTFLEDEFDTEIPFMEFRRKPTFQEAVDFIVTECLDETLDESDDLSNIAAPAAAAPAAAPAASPAAAPAAAAPAQKAPGEKAAGDELPEGAYYIDPPKQPDNVAKSDHDAEINARKRFAIKEVFQGEEIDTIKGRALFLYTDGLNEAENREHEQFGDDQLLSILRNTHFESAQQVVETLYNEVQRHRDGADPNDDLTMMCLRMQ